VAALTPEDVAALAREVEARIPFNRVLGLHLESLDVDRALASFDMRDELVGNFAKRALHGGVISAALDLIGGMTALVAAAARPGDTDPLEAFATLGTIDLRIDYLRPGVGERFVASGRTLRAGTRVAVTRMELRNEDDMLIAVGTGTYIIG
jgi:uncharacterized protein (TIGR00369 family)